MDKQGKYGPSDVDIKQEGVVSFSPHFGGSKSMDGWIMTVMMDTVYDKDELQLQRPFSCRSHRPVSHHLILLLNTPYLIKQK